MAGQEEKNQMVYGRTYDLCTDFVEKLMCFKTTQQYITFYTKYLINHITYVVINYALIIFHTNAKDGNMS